MKKLTKIFALVLVATIVATIIGVNTPVSAANATKVVTVTTEKALMKEIAKKSAATIILETSKSTTITTKSKVAKTIKRAKNKKVIIDAPNAKVRNYLKFKTLTIKNAKSVSERVNGNTITVKSATTKFSVYKNITVKKLTIPAYTQVTLGKKAKITTVKYTKTKPAKVTATPTQAPVVTTVPTTIPAPTETPTPVVVPTQTPVVTEVPTQAPTVTEAPTVTPLPKNAYRTLDDGTVIFNIQENGNDMFYSTVDFPAYFTDGKVYYVDVLSDGTILATFEGEKFNISESDITYPKNWVAPAYWPLGKTTPTVTESQSASPEITATTTITVTPEPTQEVEVTTTPEPTQEVEITTTPEPTQEVEVTTTPEPTQEVEITTTPEPTQEVEPITTEHVHSFTNTHYKKYKVNVLHTAEYTTEPVFECNNPDCRCKFYTIINNTDGTQSIEYWTEDAIYAHSANHANNKEKSNIGTTYVSIISKAAYYTEEVKEICVCDICGEHCNTSYEIICEVD